MCWSMPPATAVTCCRVHEGEPHLHPHRGMVRCTQGGGGGEDLAVGALRLWVSFYPFTQDEYLAIVAQWLTSMGLGPAEVQAARPHALVWALGVRRAAPRRLPVARDYCGRQGAAVKPAPPVLVANRSARAMAVRTGRSPRWPSASWSGRMASFC